jgi:exonuclease III
MKFVIWNVRSLYTAGSITAAAKELARYKLDLEGLQEVKWDTGGMVTVETIFSMEKKMKDIN